MRIPYNSPWLLGAGLAVSAVFGVVIGWGQVRAVSVPRKGYWQEPPVVCAHAQQAEVAAAVTWWGAQGWPLILSCDGATVHVHEDPLLDERASYDDAEITHGSTVRRQDGALIRSAEVRVLPHAGALVIAHELGHALGFEHPIAAPSGHLMHPRTSSAGWDSRGLQRR